MLSRRSSRPDPEEDSLPVKGWSLERADVTGPLRRSPGFGVLEVG